MTCFYATNEVFFSVLNLFRRRDLMIRIFIAAVLGTVCVMMVVTLIPGFGLGTSTSDTASVAAQVGEEQITVDQIEQKLRLLSRSNPVPTALYPVYGRVLLDQMVLEHILTGEGKRLGLRVSDFELADQIRQMPLFYPGGTFIGKDRYQELVEQRFGLSVSEFEKQVKTDLLLEKVRAVVTDGVRITRTEVEREYRRRNEKIKVDFVVFSRDEEAKKLEPSTAELDAYYRANRNRYQVAEKRKVKYILLSPALLRSELKLPEEQLRDYYQRNLDAFRFPERVHVRHILFKTVGMNDQEVNKVRQQALDVLRRLKQGANFDQLAKQYSEDPGSKGTGGDIGWISRGQTVPEFEQAAFSLPKGKISDVVKTQYGFHILKVEDKQAARVQTIEEVRPRIEQTLLQERLEQLVQDRASKIADALQRQRRPFEEVARDYHLQLFETPYFAVDEALPFGRQAEFNEAGFRLRVGEISGQLRLNDGIAFLQVSDAKPAHQGEMSEPEVAARVKKDYLNDKALEVARRRAQEFADRVRKAEEFVKLAKQMGVELKTGQPFNRDGSIEGLGSAHLLAGAFDLRVGAVGGPVNLSQPGSFAVYRVVERQEIDREAFERSRASLEKEMLERKRTDVFDQFREGVRLEMIRAGKLKIYQENLKRLSRESS